jgi:hAT family C-terminal dimerisation region
MSEDQWNTAKKLFGEFAVKFLPEPNDLVPQFLALDNDVNVRMVDLLADIPIRPDPPPLKKPRLAVPPPAGAVAPAAAVDAALRDRGRKDRMGWMALDMDGEQEEEQHDEKEDDHDIHCEIKAWFDRDHGAKFLMWDNADSQPGIQWSKLYLTFPRLSMLARRFLCILPSSAPSERVWSGFGHIIDKTSSTIDSTLAAHIMFLRANKDMLESIPLS